MNKKTGTTLSLTMILGLGLGLILANPSAAYADSEWNRGHSRHGHYERYSNEHGHNKNNTYQSRIVYSHSSHRPDYQPDYQPSYQVVYYRPWGYVPEMRRFTVGEYLPARIQCHEPPRNVVAILPPVHRGTRYVQVDQNVYLISEASKQILDAVVLLSGVR